MNNIKQLPRLMVFASVAQKGSFTQAAHALGITKSAVSQQISLLEKELGVAVLNRTTRGVAPTALGETLLHRCQTLQDQVDLIFADISNAGIRPKGRLAITFPHALEARVVMPAIEQLCIEYPGLEPELIVSDSSLDLVTNKIDVAIHAGDLPDSTYRALPVGTMTEIFCATPLYLNRHGLPSNVKQLERHKWIATSWQKAGMSIIDLKTNKHQSIKLNQFTKTNTLASALELALRHMGVVLLPDVVARPLIKSGELVHIVNGITGPLWPVYTSHAYPKEKPIQITRLHQLICQFFNNLQGKT